MYWLPETNSQAGIVKWLAGSRKITVGITVALASLASSKLKSMSLAGNLTSLVFYDT